ncbi:hypothetical protein HC776_03610 [bacterium]|nr:hypothetical protein [bacterium]
MNSTPPANRLLKASVIGVGLAVLGIGLFVALYFGMSGVEALPRLLLALCVPPLAIGVLVGGYALVTGRFSSQESS